MQILLSSAKTLAFDSPWNLDSYTKPVFLSKAEILADELSSLSKEELKKVLHVSQKLVDVNYPRYQNWTISHTQQNARPALFAYAGDVYQKLKLHSYSPEEVAYACSSMRIVSGLYGILRGSDLMQPYRLEMATKLRFGANESLYDFWRDDITLFLNQDARLHNHEVLINLASDEYSKAVNFSLLDIPTVHIEFRQRDRGELKNYSILTKLARAHFLAFMIENQIQSVSQLESFDRDGYSLFKKENSSLFYVKDKKV